tara:strand:+ start:258 stop:536 length:279 start_codon:yes stop_codon:yes gene_type:complete
MAILGMVGRQLIKLGLDKEARRKIKKHIQKGNLKVSGKEIKMTPKGSYKQESSLYREANPRKDIPEGILMEQFKKLKPIKKKVVKKKKRGKK